MSEQSPVPQVQGTLEKEPGTRELLLFIENLHSQTKMQQNEEKKARLNERNVVAVCGLRWGYCRVTPWQHCGTWVCALNPAAPTGMFNFR